MQHDEAAKDTNTCISFSSQVQVFPSNNMLQTNDFRLLILWIVHLFHPPNLITQEPLILLLPAIQRAPSHSKFSFQSYQTLKIFLNCTKHTSHRLVLYLVMYFERPFLGSSSSMAALCGNCPPRCLRRVKWQRVPGCPTQPHHPQLPYVPHRGLIRMVFHLPSQKQMSAWRWAISSLFNIEAKQC